MVCVGPGRRMEVGPRECPKAGAVSMASVAGMGGSAGGFHSLRVERATGECWVPSRLVRDGALSCSVVIRVQFLGKGKARWMPEPTPSTPKAQHLGTAVLQASRSSGLTQ